MDTSELQSKIQYLQDENPVVRLNRWFATHLQKEVDSFLHNGINDLVTSFEEEWSLDLSDEGKANLIKGLGVRVEVNGVPSGSPFS